MGDMEVFMGKPTGFYHRKCSINHGLSMNGMIGMSDLNWMRFFLTLSWIVRFQAWDHCHVIAISSECVP